MSPNHAPTDTRVATSPTRGAATVVTTPSEALGLLRAAGIEPTERSPVGGTGIEPADPSPATRRALVDARWLAGDERPELTVTGRMALERLAHPRRRTALLLGTPGWWFAWEGLGAEPDATDDPLLAVTMRGDGTDTMNGGAITLAFPHAPWQWLDLLAAHLRVGHVVDTVGLAAQLGPGADTALAALLDAYLESQLRATLDRAAPAPGIDVERLLDALAEGRSSPHGAWQVSVGAALWPQFVLPADRADIVAGLAELERCDLVTSSGPGRCELTERGLALVDGLVPVARWAGVAIEREDVGLVQRLVVRRGIGATLVERLVDGPAVMVRTIDDVGLEALLLDLRGPWQPPVRQEG